MTTANTVFVISALDEDSDTRSILGVFTDEAQANATGQWLSALEISVVVTPSNLNPSNYEALCAWTGDPDAWLEMYEEEQER